MSEHFPKPSPDLRNSPLFPQEQEGNFRYFETVLQPGYQAAHILRYPKMYRRDEPQIIAYIRASAQNHGEADVVRLEDVRTIPKSPDGTKEVYGKVIPATATYVLVDAKQTESGIPDLAILTDGQEYEFGRETPSTSDFSMSPETSRRHFKVSVSDNSAEVTIQDLGSTYGVAILEQLQTTQDGTPIKHPGSYSFSPDDLRIMEKKLQVIDTAPGDSMRKAAARDVLTRGIFEGHVVDCSAVMRKAFSGLKSREFLANLVLRDIDVARILADKDIVGLHGTRSSALLGIMQMGMQSAAALREAGYVVIAGEHVFQVDNGQKDTSFSTLAGSQEVLKSYAKKSSIRFRSLPQLKHELLSEAHNAERRAQEIENLKRKKIYQVIAQDRRRAAAYIEQNPESLYTQMLQHDFPVVIGIHRMEVNRQSSLRGQALFYGVKEFDEFRISTKNPIPMESFPVVVVPQQYTQWVRELLVYFGHSGVEVVPIEAFGEGKL